MAITVIVLLVNDVNVCMGGKPEIAGFLHICQVYIYMSNQPSISIFKKIKT